MCHEWRRLQNLEKDNLVLLWMAYWNRTTQHILQTVNNWNPCFRARDLLLMVHSISQPHHKAFLSWKKAFVTRTNKKTKKANTLVLAFSTLISGVKNGSAVIVILHSIAHLPLSWESNGAMWQPGKKKKCKEKQVWCWDDLKQRNINTHRNTHRNTHTYTDTQTHTYTDTVQSVRNPQCMLHTKKTQCNDELHFNQNTSIDWSIDVCTVCMYVCMHVCMYYLYFIYQIEHFCCSDSEINSSFTDTNSHWCSMNNLPDPSDWGVVKEGNQSGLLDTTSDSGWNKPLYPWTACI